MLGENLRIRSVIHKEKREEMNTFFQQKDLNESEHQHTPSMFIVVMGIISTEVSTLIIK